MRQEGHEEIFKILPALFFKADSVAIDHQCQCCVAALVELIVCESLLYLRESCQKCVCGLHSLFPPLGVYVAPSLEQ